jgi:hypothetical protein
MVLSSRLNEVNKSVISVHESVNVINDSNKRCSEYKEGKLFKHRVIFEEIGQLKVAMIKVDESFVDIVQAGCT